MKIKKYRPKRTRGHDELHEGGEAKGKVKAKKYRPKRMPPLEINVQRLDEIVDKARKNPVSDEEGDLLRNSIHAMAERLQRQCQPRTSERSEDVLEDGKSGEDQREAAPAEGPPQPVPEKKPRPGHGRNGVDAFTGAKVIPIPHPELAPRCLCPGCCKGRVYEVAGVKGVLRILGMPPIQANHYKPQTLRCNTCGQVYAAKLPPEIGEERYDASVASMVAQLRYGSGVPFYRIERLQAQAGVPLPAGTQFDLVDAAAGKLGPVYDEMRRLAAQGYVLYHDDTRVRILDAVPVPEGHDEDRTGLHTTGLVSDFEGHRIAVFTSGPNHAGENLGEVLQEREEGLPSPVIMNDALNHNTSKLPPELEALLGSCLVHGRRQFVNVLEAFPEACRHVIVELGHVYDHDAQARRLGLDEQQRLDLHRDKSGPVMDELKKWMESQLGNRLAEPNSGLGRAIRYFLKRWDRLTLFLRHPGAPLDNTIAERALKKAVLHRKNSLFYKTQHGADVGDLFMSLIHTCELNKVDSFRYITTLLRHPDEVEADPAAWLPWKVDLRPPPG